MLANPRVVPVVVVLLCALTGGCATERGVVRQASTSTRDGVLAVAIRSHEARDAKATERGANPNGEVPILDRYADEQTLRRQAVLAEYHSLMNLSRRLLAEGKYDSAKHAAIQARTVLDKNRRFLRPAVRESNTWQADQQVDETESRRLEAKRDLEAQLEAEREAEASARRSDARREARDEAQRLLRRVDDLRRQQQYDRALHLLAQARLLDPNHSAIEAMTRAIEDARVLTAARWHARLRPLSTAWQRAAKVEATTPYAGVVSYSTDWPTVTATRGH